MIAESFNIRRDEYSGPTRDLTPMPSKPDESVAPTTTTPEEPKIAPELGSMEQTEQPASHERVGDTRSAIMFWAATLTLLIQGFMLAHGISERANQSMMMSPILAWPLLVLWVLIILEGLLGMATAQDAPGKMLKRFLLTTLVPPFRIAYATAYPHKFVWLPKHGWISVTKLNFERMELRLALPMLAVTLLVLPLLGIELFLRELLVQHLWAAMAVHIFTSIVWFAFALEFIIMFSLAEKKLVYCKRHWVNIAIILLPYIACLRMFRLFHFLRMAKASKILRAYRLRGIVARGMRLALVFNLIDRLMERNPAKYLIALEEQISEKKAELKALEEKVESVREKVAEQERQQAEAMAKAMRHS